MKAIEEIKKEAKLFIDANVHDGEDRAGCKGDRANFDPDDLQELADDLVEHVFESLIREINDRDSVAAIVQKVIDLNKATSDSNSEKYAKLKEKLEAYKEVVDAAKEFCETLHINKNEPPVPVAGKMKLLMESVNKLNNDKTTNKSR